MSASQEEQMKLAQIRKLTIPLVRVNVNRAAEGEHRLSREDKQPTTSGTRKRANASPASDDESPPTQPLKMRTRGQMSHHRSTRTYSVADLTKDDAGVNMENDSKNDVAVPPKTHGRKRPSPSSADVRPPPKNQTVEAVESSGGVVEELPQSKVSDGSSDPKPPVNDANSTMDGKDLVSADNSQQQVIADDSAHVVTATEVGESPQELEKSLELFPVDSLGSTSDSGIDNQSGELVPAGVSIEPDPDQPKSDFTMEGFFDYLLPRAAKTKASSQQLLADILKRDHIFLVVHRQYLELRGNGYLMNRLSTEELYGKMFDRLKGIVEGELGALTSNYHDVLNVLTFGS